MQELGVNAVGISGKDGGMLKVEKKIFQRRGHWLRRRDHKKSIRRSYMICWKKIFFRSSAQSAWMKTMTAYNINADDAACAIARAVHAEKLAFLTDIEGVYKDPKDPSTLISELPISEAKKLIEDGYIGGGMLPKLNNCIDAIENGVSRVHILDGRIAHCLLLEIFTNRGIGTAILGDKETKYYHE